MSFQSSPIEFAGVSVIVRVVAVEFSEPEPLAVVLGRNCKRIRREIRATQDDLARHARAIGLNWTETKVGHFEAGRVGRPTFAMVLAVTLALQMALEETTERRDAADGVTLADLVGDKGYIALTGGLSVPAVQVQEVCRGGKFPIGDQQYRLTIRHPEPLSPDEIAAAAEQMAKWLRTDAKPLVDGIADALQRSGLTERRLAKHLRITDQQLAAASFLLWQSTFSEERDRQAGPDANQQKRGRITRALRAELEKALTDGDN